MEIRELKQKLDILEVAAQLGIQTDKHGKARCPFHDDKNPSLQFSREKQIATCFSGNCTAGTMDVIGLVEKKLNLSTHEALLYLGQLAGVSATPSPKAATPKAEHQARIAVLTKVQGYFRKGIANSEPGKAYAQEKRGLDLEKTEVGYNSGQFHHRENSYLIQSCVEAGLLKPNPSGGHYVWGKHCITFALRNRENQITSLYGRSITEKKDQTHFYLRDREGLYPCYPKKETRILLLAESIIDAATLQQSETLFDKPYSILALYGTNGLTAEHLAAIGELAELEETILFLDGDDAGREAAKKHAETLSQLKPRAKVTNVETPEGEDVNSLIRSHEPGVLKHLIEKRHLFYSPEKAAEKKEAPTKPAPKATAPALDTTDPHKLRYPTGTATYHVLGGIRKEPDSLKVTLAVEHPRTGRKSRGKLDLYEDRQVEKAAREAAEKLGLRAQDIEGDLAALTDLLESHRENLAREQGREKETTAPTADRTKQCLDFLGKPDLIGRLNKLIGEAGVVGEETNRIFLFAIAASYKTASPLHALVQGSSGSGKTHLMIRIAELMPPEDVTTLTRVTESSLYNYGEHELRNKLLCMEDLDGLKEEALLAFRELQSRGMLTSSTSGKDEQGNIRSFVRTVRGPIASMSATTKGEVYEDNMSRSFLVAVDETPEQTKRIIRHQNDRAAGLVDTAREREVTEFIRDCVRLIKPHQVINPHANRVQLPEEAHKIRRLNELYQSYVRQITLLNQYRRRKDEKGRLVAEKEDLETAGEIMFDSIIMKIDELDGVLRLFYEKLKKYVEAKGGSTHKNYAFGRKEVRDALRVSKTQQHRFLNDLLSLEYIHQAGGSPHTGHKYRITEWDDIKELRGRIKKYLKGQLDQLEMFQAVPDGTERQNNR